MDFEFTFASSASVVSTQSIASAKYGRAKLSHRQRLKSIAPTI